MSPDEESSELLGSLTTQQQQRTSARVIKKLRLESPADKRETTECLPSDCTQVNSKEDKDPLKFPTVKQRMPKALWSADEKSLFFEALNEYGKDFDAITAYICAKMKKKGMIDGNLKTKTQVSHFYYRTWHKLSKHVRFDENVKKVAQELYALINYGELRRKLESVSEKTCARLGEMVRSGSMAVRARGKTLRVRTPMCRALRRLNQITERACGTRVCSRAQIQLRARDAGGWTRVQAAAHNPRLAATLPLRTTLVAFLRALQRRWKIANYKHMIDMTDRQDEQSEELCETNDKHEAGNHLHLETDRIIQQENKRHKKLALHVGPRPDAEIHLPVLSPSEQLSSQKICFSSYLERMGSLHRDKDSGVKIRTPKRQRKDSASEKEKDDSKKMKADEAEVNKLINIDETAIDGIELMAQFKMNLDDDEKPSEDEKDLKLEEVIEKPSEDEKDLKSEEDVDREPERDNALSEREKDSFSEMEDEEKYNNDTDNESDGKPDKEKKKEKFKNLKVKFRLRPKKRGGSIFTLVMEKDSDDPKCDDKVEEPKLQLEEETKQLIDVELATQQIRTGWSCHDAGDLTIGDLYLMFGSRSRLELDYWWAVPKPPLPPKLHKTSESDKDRVLDKREKGNKTPEKNDSSVEDEKDRSDSDMFVANNQYSQESNDALSGDERKGEAFASPDHKSSSTLKLVSKLVNNPTQSRPSDGFAQLSDRLRRLLALAGNTHVGSAASTVNKCSCGHVCPQKKQKQQTYPVQMSSPLAGPPVSSEMSSVFRHPTPIAPKPDACEKREWSLEGLPPWRRGRPRVPQRVVVQRLLPLLPKLPPTSNLIPVKLVPNSSPQTPVRILPKPPPPAPTSTADLSAYYVLTESNGQFFFHDGDRRIPINPPEDNPTDTADNVKIERQDVKTELAETNGDGNDSSLPSKIEIKQNDSETDMTGFLRTESVSLSPSRLLRDEWLEGSVQDFSLSSFLNQLDGRPNAELGVESQLQSLMAESSVDYVAKFADLAAEVTDENVPDDTALDKH
ncbi:protein cramped isoform X2 [Leptidea sinapis]|nr:protein cramped isoform X2 [Leptidea sinapis]